MREYIIMLSEPQLDILLSWFDLLEDDKNNFDVEVYDSISKQMAEQIHNRLFKSEG